MLAPPLPNRSARPWQVALLVAGLALAWQTLVVYGYFHGHWSALFYTGDRFDQSPDIRAESTYPLPKSSGFDGQFYHAIAHDPLDLRRTDRYIDAPHIRYLRILLPALSYALGGGRLLWIDRAYRSLELMFLFLGVYCASVWAERRNRSVWWGAIFLLMPGVFISLERQLSDLPLCALLAAAIVSSDCGRDKQCWAWLACAGLAREGGLVIVAGFALSAATEGRFKQAVQWVLAGIPALIWSAYVLLLIPQPPTGLSVHRVLPVLSIFRAAWDLQQYPFGAVASLFLHALDLLAIFGLLLSFALGLSRGVRQKGPLANVGLVWTCFGIAASATTLADYTEVYNFARQNSPLLLVQLFQVIEGRSAGALSPLALMLPRSLAIDARMTVLSILHLAGW